MARDYQKPELFLKLKVRERTPYTIYFDSQWEHCAGQHQHYGGNLCCLKCGGYYNDHGSPWSHLTCTVPAAQYPTAVCTPRYL